MSKNIGVCAKCGREISLFARGICGMCYKRQKKDIQDVDCFAYRPNVTNGQCNVTGGACKMRYGDPCAFHRTVADHAVSRVKAFERIRSLPQEQRESITQTYLMQKEGEE